MSFRDPVATIPTIRARALWLTLLVSSTPSWAFGCRDTQVDPGFCATCPVDTRTHDGQAVSQPSTEAGNGSIDTGAAAGDSAMNVAANGGNASESGGMSAIDTAGSGSAGRSGAPATAGTNASTGSAGTSAAHGGTGGALASGGAGGRSSQGGAGRAGSGVAGASGGPPPVAGASGIGECSAGQTRACDTNPTKPVCNVVSHLCVPCTQQDRGACKGDLPACDAGNICVQCTATDSSACAGDTSVCNEDNHQCVQCLAGGLGTCPANLPACNAKNQCVECTDNVHCGMAAPRCDAANSTCLACASDGDCQRFATTPLCEPGSGSCVACTRDTETVRCPGTGCNVMTHNCYSTPPGNSTECMPCQNDRECAAGLACVAQAAGHGSFCFRQLNTPGCTGTAANDRPFSHVVSATSVGGVQGSFCEPSASCASVLAAGMSCTKQGPMNANVCGGASVSDGQCVDDKCTYHCQEDSDCALQSSGCMSGVCK